MLVFHVGTPNATVAFTLLTDALDGRGWQLVAYARPGYAGSARREGRSVADAAASRAGVAPFDAEGLDFLAGMGPENVEEFGAAARSRDELEAFLERFADGLATVTGEQVGASLGGLVDDIDRRALTGELAETMARMFRRALSTGTAGWFDDDLAFVKPWGFDLSEIAVPVSIWQGADDRFVPFSHGEWLAAHVPRARVHLYEDEGHISLVGQLPRIRDDLVSRTDA